MLTIRLADLLYEDSLYSVVERKVDVGVGESVPIYNSAEKGGYTIVTTSYEGEPLLEFPQIGKAVLYTTKYRFAGKESETEELRYLLLPLLATTEKNQIVCSDSFGLTWELNNSI